MNKLSLLMLSFLIIASFTGCSPGFLPERMEINELNMIRAVGVDKGSKDPGNICVTVLSKKHEGGEGGKSGAQQAEETAMVLTNEALTILEAERELACCIGISLCCFLSSVGCKKTAQSDASVYGGLGHADTTVIWKSRIQD